MEDVFVFQGGGGNVQKFAVITPSTVIREEGQARSSWMWGSVNTAKLLGRTHLHRAITFWNALHSNQIISQEDLTGNSLHAKQI